MGYRHLWKPPYVDVDGLLRSQDGEAAGEASLASLGGGDAQDPTRRSDVQEKYLYEWDLMGD